MFKKIPLLLIAIAVISTGISVKTNAVSASDWDAGYIIDDATFTDKSAMSVQEIQTFLNQHVGTGGYGKTAGQCDTYGTATSELGGGTRAQYGAAHGNPTPFTCLKDYYEVPKTSPSPNLPANNYGGKAIPQGAKSAAQLIWDAAQQYNISPKVLLVKIQTESAGPLTTDDWPTMKQYYYAMGSHCPDSGPNGSANCDANYAGFSIQISSAAALMRSYLDNMRQSWWTNKKPEQVNYLLWNVAPSNCGGSNVYIQNSATAALYTYTPYQPNQAALANIYGSGDGCSAYGNRNFWRVFNDWFGKTKGTYLLQSPRSSTVYLQSGTTRYAIPSGEVLWAYGLNTTAITPVTDSYIDSLSDGGVLNTLFKIDGDGTIYVADNGYRFGIASTAICNAWGFANCTSTTTKTLSSIITNRILPGGDLKTQALNGSTVYLMTNGTKQPFLTTKSLSDRGYSISDYTPVTNPLNFTQPFGQSLPENNSFVQLNSGAIYAYNNGKFFTIPNFDTYKAWYNEANTLQVDKNSSYNQTAPIPSGVLLNYIFLDNGKKYLIDRGQKIDITQSSSDWPDQTNFSSLQTMTERLPTNQTNAQNAAFRTSNGMIFKVQSKSVQPFNSLYDYFESGYTEGNIVNVSNQVTDSMPTGRTVFAQGKGSLFKSPVAGQENAIYTITSNDTSCQLTSTSQFAQFKFDTSYVPKVTSQTIASLSSTGVLTGLVKTSEDAVYIIDSYGFKYPVSSQTLTTWGLNATSSCVFAPEFLSKIPSSSKDLGRFISDSKGTIYFAEQGKKRPIGSFQKFIQLGGNTSNTSSLTDDVINQMPTGQPY
jgi:hypothetical protein